MGKQKYAEVKPSGKEKLQVVVSYIARRRSQDCIHPTDTRPPLAVVHEREQLLRKLKKPVNAVETIFKFLTDKEVKRWLKENEDLLDALYKDIVAHKIG